MLVQLLDIIKFFEPLASDDDDGAATISSFGAFLLIALLILKRANKEKYPPSIAIHTKRIQKVFVS